MSEYEPVDLSGYGPESEITGARGMRDDRLAAPSRPKLSWEKWMLAVLLAMFVMAVVSAGVGLAVWIVLIVLGVGVPFWKVWLASFTLWWVAKFLLG